MQDHVQAVRANSALHSQVSRLRRGEHAFAPDPSGDPRTLPNTCSPPPQIPGRSSARCARPSGVPSISWLPLRRSLTSCRRARPSTTSRTTLTAFRCARPLARGVPAPWPRERSPARRPWPHARGFSAAPHPCGEPQHAPQLGGRGRTANMIRANSERAATRRPAARPGPGAAGARRGPSRRRGAEAPPGRGGTAGARRHRRGAEAPPGRGGTAGARASSWAARGAWGARPTPAGSAGRRPSRSRPAVPGPGHLPLHITG
jgi:hypothetical protein